MRNHRETELEAQEDQLLEEGRGEIGRFGGSQRTGERPSSGRDSNRMVMMSAQMKFDVQDSV